MFRNGDSNSDDEEKENNPQKIILPTKSQDKSNKARSVFSLEGAKPPLSLYTRRVMNVPNIINILSKDSSHGVCGSYNLGNTCFMNSSIACLSNCIELTYYFLCGDYEKDINRENKYGLRGRLAESWAELLKEYWIGSRRTGNPSDFKDTFGHKIKRFSGYNQQDSNEFIDLFLDILNEDLNSVVNKEYIELKEKRENESDEQCSKRFWDNYLKRNDSIVTDLFFGQMKSTVTCPKCKYINITFDPFNTLNLNIPETSRKHRYYSDYTDKFIIFYVPKYNLRTPVKIIYIDILKKAKFKDCVRAIKNENDFHYHNKINKWILNRVSSNKSIEFINENDEKEIDDYDDSDYYFSFDIMNEKENKYIPLYFKEPGGLSVFPRILMVSEKESTMDDLRKKIYFYIRKLILSPLKDNDEEMDELSQKIKEYTKNYEIEDDAIFDLINKEYEKVFKTDNEKIQNFLQDIPFQLYLAENIKYNYSEKIYIINKENFNNLSEEFIKLTKIKTYEDHIENLLKLLEENQLNLVIEFDKTSRYINTELFKLDNCIKYKLNYVEEEKEQNQDNDSGIITLKKCFNLFSTEEKLKDGDEWYCPNCKTHVLANKKMELYYTPKILIICFKRFIKHYTYWERNDENIIFPINNLDMKEFIVGPDKEHSVYDLFAVSQHYGGTGGGHYTAVCKNFGKWYSYDDSSVHETNEQDVITNAAYVLFYRRRTD